MYGPTDALLHVAGLWPSMMDGASMIDQQLIVAAAGTAKTWR
jgi:hypothetical protein